MGFALVHAEDGVHVEQRVDAGDDRGVLGRRKRQRAGEFLSVPGVVPQVLVGDGHVTSCVVSQAVCSRRCERVVISWLKAARSMSWTIRASDLPLSQCHI